MLRIATLLILVAWIAGCGNKGPLYLPSQTPADNNQQAPRK
jgi:predicted small lipoprotein YifL